MFFKNLIKGYIIVSLSENMLYKIEKIAHRKTKIDIQEKTEKHIHKWFSFYIAENMYSLQTFKCELKIPSRSLVIVLPFVMHGWSNKKGTSHNCFVYDISPFHKPHIIIN